MNDKLVLPDLLKNTLVSPRNGITFISGKKKHEFTTYPELYRIARLYANALLLQGMQKGDELIIYTNDNAQFIKLFWGAIIAGVIPVPIAIGNTEEHQNKLVAVWEILNNPYCIIDEAEANLDALLNVAENSKSEDFCNSMSGRMISSESLDLSNEGFAEPNIKPCDIAFIQFSSGSTGVPKGVVLTHENLITNVEAFSKRACVIKEKDISLSWMPLTHDMGLIGFHLGPLYNRMNQYIMPTSLFIRKPGLWLETANNIRATILSSPNFGYEFFLKTFRKSQAKNWDLSCVKLIFNGAEPISYDLCINFLDHMEPYKLNRNVIFPSYGMAEASLAVTLPDPCVPLEKLDLDRDFLTTGDTAVEVTSGQSVSFVKVGYLVDNCEIKICDDELTEVKNGCIGNILIRGKNVTARYYNNPEKNSELFHEGNWLDTGDVGLITKSNEVVITGRKKDVLFVNGQNFYSFDIERILEAELGVANGKAAAWSVFNHKTEHNELLLFVVHRKKEYSEFYHLSRTIKKVVNQKLGVNFDKIIPINAIPKTTSGKLQRHQLGDSYLMGTYDSVVAELENLHQHDLSEREFVQPANEIEEELFAMWSDLLATDKLGTTSDFFNDHGGHSLLAAQLLGTVNMNYNCDISLSNFYLNPTIHFLAKEIQSGGNAGEKEILPAVIEDPAMRYQPFPLTDMQQAQWIGRVGAFSMGNVAAQLYFEVENSDIDIARLNKSWQDMVERHEILRTIILDDGTQKILEAVPLYTIDVVDLCSHTQEDRSEILADIREEMDHSVRPVNKWPLFDIRTTVLPENRTRIHVSIDVLICDVVSFKIIQREWSHLYEKEVSQLPDLSLSFRDYILAEEKLADTKLYKKCSDHWDAAVKTLPGIPQLPFALDPSEIKKPLYKRRDFRLNNKTWNQFSHRCNEEGISPSMVIFAAFGSVLANWSRNSGFCISTTIMNRFPLHEQVNNIMGEFTSFAPLAVRTNANKNLKSLALECQRQNWENLENRFVNGTTILRKLAKYKGSNFGGTIPVVFTSTLVHEDQGEENFTEQFGDFLYVITQHPQVWLDHTIFQDKDGVVLAWHVVEELFPADILDAMWESYQSILKSLTEENDAWFKPYSSLTPASQIQVIEETNMTEQNIHSKLLHKDFFSNISQWSDNACVITSSKSFTYRTIAGWASRLSGEIIMNDCKPSELIAIIMDKGWEQVVSVMAILNAGCAYLPISQLSPVDRIEYILEKAGVTTVLTAASTRQKISEALKNKHCLIRLSEDKLENHYSTPLSRSVETSSLAYTIFTSGSTGNPKGVMITHEAATNTIQDINNRFAVNSTDRTMALADLSFDLSVYDIFGPLSVGGAIVMIDYEKSREPDHWLELAEKHSVTIWNSVPAFWGMFVAFIQTENHKTFLRATLLSGDWIPLDLFDQTKKEFPEIRFTSLGGATEASIWSIIYDVVKIEPQWKSIPYGKALANQTMYVLDENLETAPFGVTGEIYIGGVGVAKGYLGEKELTEKAFLIHPKTRETLYRTADLGRYYSDGNIEFLGRDDFQVKIGGYRIELEEIESAIAAHENVELVLVDVRKNRQGSARLIAYVQTSDSTLVSGDIEKFISATLPSYMIPAEYNITDVFPLTANGKVDRNKLTSVTQNREAVDDHQTETCDESNPVFIELRKVFAEILQRDISEIDPDANFFSMGGDSIMGIQVIAKAKERNITVSPNDLFEYPTLSSLTMVLLADTTQKKYTGIMKNVFAEILSMKANEIDVEENFFAMGGDSIMGIQVIAKAKEYGIKISPETLFENPSIVSLVNSISGEKEASLPYQNFLAEAGHDEIHNSCLVNISSLEEEVDTDLLEKAFNLVLNEYPLFNYRASTGGESTGIERTKLADEVELIKVEITEQHIEEESELIDLLSDAALDTENGAVSLFLLVTEENEYVSLTVVEGFMTPHKAHGFLAIIMNTYKALEKGEYPIYPSLETAEYKTGIDICTLSNEMEYYTKEFHLEGDYCTNKLLNTIEEHLHESGDSSLHILEEGKLWEDFSLEKKQRGSGLSSKGITTLVRNTIIQNSSFYVNRVLKDNLPSTAMGLYDLFIDITERNNRVQLQITGRESIQEIAKGLTTAIESVHQQ